ncbi:coiled-coil domain-containing protein 40-like [Diorhabda carinulata]|uniref:coiled-coil domain-containing protein 40-like n=1 Tax=Diorhabda carinulata TaxID=1163345 RepID=UPI0025A04645|nr:coiled-coil domain-containing protein 40-like [Diorhabda carinulata]
MDTKDDTDLSKAVLEPEHPLLAQFQEALKEYLLSQIDRAKEDIFVIEQDITYKNKEIEAVGERTYEMQQMVCKQHNQLETLINDIKLKESEQQKEENNLIENKKVLKEIENKLFQSGKVNKELQAETKAVTDLNNHLLRYGSKFETQLNVNRRILEKARKDDEQLNKQKIRQDYMLHTLEKELWKHEAELEQIHLQVSTKQSELDKLEECVITENTNIVARQTEYKCLMLSWKAAYNAVGARSKILDEVSGNLNKLNEKYRAMKMETIGTKKLCKLELEENEKLVHLKNRAELDIKNITSQLVEERSKRIEIESKLFDLQRVMQETETGLEEVKQEVKPKQIQQDRICKEINDHFLRKQSIEKEILEIIQNKITHEASRKKVETTLAAMQHKKKEINTILLEVENRHASVVADYEEQKIHNENLNFMYNDLCMQLDKLEKEAGQVKSQKEKYEFRYRKLQKTFAAKTIQLERLTASRNVELGSKSDLRIVELNKAIDDTQESIKKLQLFWLREQNNILIVSGERQQQIHNINLRKKEVLILEQKNMRIDDEIQQIRQNEKKVSNAIDALSTKSKVLSEYVFKTRNKKTTLDKTTTLLQSQYESKLKDSELQLLELEAEIAQAEEEKLVLSKNLIETNREGLEWEKKFHEARNTYLDIKNEKGAGGDTSNLKIQIHRLNVIYSELKKVQEKLLCNLKHCISRRESIFFVSEAKESKDAAMKRIPGSKMRMNILKKIDNIRNQIKQSNNETETIKKSILSVQQQILEAKRNLQDTIKGRSDRENRVLHLQNQLESAKTNRQFKFEILLLKQRRAAMYKQIVKQQKPHLKYNDEDDLINEYKYQKNQNKKLMKILEYITRDFPSKITVLNRLYNSLGIVQGSIYT